MVAPWSEVESKLTGYERVAVPIPHLELTYREPPADVIELVKRSWPRATKNTFTGIAADSVLDAELLSG